MAAVELWERRLPMRQHSSGTATGRQVQILPPQPTLRTEKDIGSENPETTTVSGFFRVIFQGAIQKISFPINELWGGLELNTLAFLGRILRFFRRVCPFFVCTPFSMIIFAQHSKKSDILSTNSLCHRN